MDAGGRATHEIIAELGAKRSSPLPAVQWERSDEVRVRACERSLLPADSATTGTPELFPVVSPF
jgi:hypothetical protein